MIDFSTAAIPVTDARAALHHYLELLCGRPATLHVSEDPVVASIRMRRFGGVNLAQLAHNAKLIAQEKRDALDGGGGHLMLFLQLSGSAVISQGGTEVKIAANEVGLLDTYRPFVCRFDGVIRQLAMYLPSAELRSRHPASVFSQPRRWTKSDAIVELFRSNFLQVARLTERFDTADEDYARDMLMRQIHYLIERDQGRRSSPRLIQPDYRIRAFIEARLADPALDPALIASGCGISLRKLHRSFADVPWTVCEWIMHRRLERSRHALLDPSLRDLSISQIAFRFGFNDAAHFSRSFRATFRQSPREARRPIC